MFPRTQAAWAKLMFNLRAMICEDAITFAYWISPDGYTPSPSAILADEIRKATPEHRQQFMAQGSKRR